MNQKRILEKVHKHIEELILYKKRPGYVFHNLKCRKNFIDDCLKLGQAADLNSEEMLVLEIASAFYKVARGIEEGDLYESSASIAQKFLQKSQVDDRKARRIVSIIATKSPKQHENILLTHILHDAEWAFLGRKKFFKKIGLLYLESKNISPKPITERSWYKEFLETMIGTQYNTPWATKKFTERKNKNLLKLKSFISDLKKQHKRFKAGKDYGRGIDTAYRVALKNHTDLSRIADGKANMIISINTLIVSVLITGLTAGLSIESFSEGITVKNYLPILILLISSLLATVFAVFSVVPNINSSKEVNLDDLEQKNLLFFGNFLAMKEPNFVRYFQNLRTDQGKLYDNLSRDLYGLGKVLQKKYQLLGISYRIFIGGLASSFLSFLMMRMIYLSV